MIKLLAQQGDLRFLVDVGDGEGPNGVKLGRVYDRSQVRLFDPFNIESIIARGYWENVTVDDETQARIGREISRILAG